MVSAISTCPRATLDCLLAPVRWVSEKVENVAKAIFGYLLRIIVFQLGEMKTTGAYYIMRFHQKLSSDPREERPFDPVRLERSKNFLIEFGGAESTVHPADGGAEVHLMSFTSEAFFQTFFNKGARLIEVMYQGCRKRVLVNAPEEDAKKFYLQTVPVRLDDGTLTRGALLPEKCPADNPPHIIHFHSPGRSMAMDRRFLGLHLAAGYNVTVSDPRGTVDSTGVASEGGYYLDAEAVFDHVRESGVPTNRIYASGYCEGAAIAAHLKKKYHAEGIHFIASNPFSSMKDVVEGHGFLGRLAAQYGLEALTDRTLNVAQDHFDNVNKLSNLDHSEGKCIFLHTDTDKLMPRGSVQDLAIAFGMAGSIAEILRVHPKAEEDGHLIPPYQDPNVWTRYVREVT